LGERIKIATGQYYMHNHGRKIAVLEKVNTYRWGEQFIIEETDTTGSAISCADVNTEFDMDRWTSIGREEWLRNFGGVQ
jgi:hypothetical protein